MSSTVNAEVAAMRRSMLLCAYSGVAFLVLFAVAMLALAQFVPPPKANDSVQEVVKLYSEDTDRLRAGLVIMMIAASLFAPWSAAMTVLLKRIEGRFAPMAYTQLAAGAANILVITVPVMIMIVAAFRPDRNPEITQTLNDLAWIPFVMVFPPVLIQCMAVAMAIFNHPEQTILPRWLAYVDVSFSVALLPAVLIPFVKSGPFAWHGAMEFWLAAVVFFGWFTVTTVVLFTVVRRAGAAA